MCAAVCSYCAEIARIASEYLEGARIGVTREYLRTVLPQESFHKAGRRQGNRCFGFGF